MDVRNIQNLLRSTRIIIMILLILVSLLLIFNIIPVNGDKGIGFGNGLDYGLDFAGGIQMQLKLEREVDKETMEIERGILVSRLNSMGLKDIPVRPWGNRYILIQISGASPHERERIENILKQPARFEQLIDGKLAVRGDEIVVDPDPRSSGIFQEQNGYGWRVGVKLMGEGAKRFGKVAYGKYFGENSPLNRPVDLFIDRPYDSIIIIDKGTYNILSNITSSSPRGGSIYYGDTAIDIIKKRANLTVVVWEGNNSEFFFKIKNLSNKYRRAIIAGDEKDIPETIRGRIEEAGFNTERIPKGNKTYEDWIKEITGLKTSPRLNFNTRGEPVYAAVITGWAPTIQDAKNEMKQNKIWLSSGNLPARATIESESEIPASLGGKFLEGSFIIGIMAIFTVAFIIYLRYRRLFIVAPVMITGLSEIIIILGLASAINWEIDLAAVAGIIAAVGTGVDDQIVITDETLRREGGKRRIISVVEQIRRAFFIIFTAAATTIAVMLPVFTIQALQGFAFTTVTGVLIGVFVTRPSYAKIIEELIEEK